MASVHEHAAGLVGRLLSAIVGAELDAQLASAVPGNDRRNGSRVRVLRSHCGGVRCSVPRTRRGSVRSLLLDTSGTDDTLVDQLIGLATRNAVQTEQWYRRSAPQAPDGVVGDVVRAVSEVVRAWRNERLDWACQIVVAPGPSDELGRSSWLVLAHGTDGVVEVIDVWSTSFETQIFWEENLRMLIERGAVIPPTLTAEPSALFDRAVATCWPTRRASSPSTRNGPREATTGPASALPRAYRLLVRCLEALLSTGTAASAAEFLQALRRARAVPVLDTYFQATAALVAGLASDDPDERVTHLRSAQRLSGAGWRRAFAGTQLCVAEHGRGDFGASREAGLLALRAADGIRHHELAAVSAALPTLLRTGAVSELPRLLEQLDTEPPPSITLLQIWLDTEALACELLSALWILESPQAQAQLLAGKPLEAPEGAGGLGGSPADPHLELEQRVLLHLFSQDVGDDRPAWPPRDRELRAPAAVLRVQRRRAGRLEELEQLEQELVDCFDDVPPLPRWLGVLVCRQRLRVDAIAARRDVDCLPPFRPSVPGWLTDLVPMGVRHSASIPSMSASVLTVLQKQSTLVASATVRVGGDWS